MVRPMSQDNKVFILGHAKKKNILTDMERLVFAYHYLESGNESEAKKLLSEVSKRYYDSTMHKDVSRALLCLETCRTTRHQPHAKEAEFYLVIYRLTKYITENKIHFNGSGYFVQLKDELFKDLM